MPVIPNQLGSFLAPVVPNLSAIVLTPAGYDLMSSFPGIAIPVSFVVTGSGGISSMQPGNGTGVPGQAATSPNGSNGGATVTIFVGSGANDIVATIIPLVTRNTIANDALNAAPLIGRVLGDRSDVLPPEQVYRGGLPVSASGGVSTEASGQRSGPNPDERPVDSVADSAPEQTTPPRIGRLGVSRQIARGSGAVILRERHRPARSAPRGKCIAMPQSSLNRPIERRSTNMGSTDDRRWEPANGAGPLRAGVALAEARDDSRPPPAGATTHPDHRAADVSTDPLPATSPPASVRAIAPLAEARCSGRGPWPAWRSGHTSWPRP